MILSIIFHPTYPWFPNFLHWLLLLLQLIYLAMLIALLNWNEWKSLVVKLSSCFERYLFALAVESAVAAAGCNYLNFLTFFSLINAHPRNSRWKCVQIYFHKSPNFLPSFSRAKQYGCWCDWCHPILNPRRLVDRSQRGIRFRMLLTKLNYFLGTSLFKRLDLFYFCKHFCILGWKIIFYSFS